LPSVAKGGKMKSKLLYSLLPACILLGACGVNSQENFNISHTQSERKEDKTNEVSFEAINEHEESSLSNEELLLSVQEYALSALPAGYEIYDVKGAALTGNSYHDFLILFKHAEDPLIHYPILMAYTYEDDSWNETLILAEDDYAGSSIQLDDAHSLVSSGKEEMILSETEGSEGFLGIYVIGSIDGKTITLLDRIEGGSAASYTVEGKIMTVEKGNLSTQLYWDAAKEEFIEKE
jgi:hypothetical protein